MKIKQVAIILLAISFFVASCRAPEAKTSEPVQKRFALLPPEEQAKETLNEFIEMCQQGQSDEAIMRYVQKDAQKEWLYDPGSDRKMDYKILYSVPSSEPVPHIDTVIYVIPPPCLNPGECTFECDPTGLYLIGFKPWVDSPPVDKAKQTAAQFFELCKQGKLEQALDGHMANESDKNNVDRKIIDYIGDYIVEGSFPDNGCPQLTKVVVAAGRYYGGRVRLLIQCNYDATRITSIKGEPLEPEDEARLTVARFLELCKAGRGRELVNVCIADEVYWYYDSVFDQLEDYRITSSSASPRYPSIIEVYVKAIGGEEHSDPRPDLCFECDQDGKKILNVQALGYVCSI